MRSSRIRINKTEENFWPSFTDMISTIAIILFFLILIIFLKNIIIGKEYDIAKSDLISTEDALLGAENALLEKADEMALLNAEISDQETNLMLIQTEAEKLKLEVVQGELALSLSQEEVLNQQTIIAMSNLELGDLRTKIQQIALIRLTVLDQVKEAIENELSTTTVDNQDVQIATNGNIILNNRLMFASNSYTITGEGQDLLVELALVFEKILEDEDIRANIDAIQIEGHTDNVNTAEYNRDLSANRAISVLDFLFQSNTTLEREYGEYFVASAYSEYRPLIEGDSEIARAQNRRIEISIILKDSNIQDIIDGYLQDSLDPFNP